MENLRREVNIMLYEMFLIATEIRQCPWVEERLAAGDKHAVLVFLRHLRENITEAEQAAMVSRILRDPAIVNINHMRF